MDVETIREMFDNASKALLFMKTHSQDPDDYTAQFQLILSSPGFEGEESIMIMASNYIPHYITYFSTFADDALDVLITLCQNNHQTVRKESIRALAKFSKNVSSSELKVTSVLCELLLTAHGDELLTVKDTLIVCYHQHPLSFQRGLFERFVSDERIKDTIKEFILNCLMGKLDGNAKAAYLTAYLNVVPGDKSPMDIDIIMALIDGCARSASERYNLRMSQLYLEMAEEIIKLEDSKIRRALLAKILYYYTSLFASGVDSSTFLEFLLEKVLDPAWDPIVDTREELNMLKYVMGNIKCCKNVGVLLGPLERMVVLYSNDLDPTSIKVKASFVKMEPLLFSILMCRAKQSEREVTQGFKGAFEACKIVAAKTVHVYEESQNNLPPNHTWIMRCAMNSQRMCQSLIDNDNLGVFRGLAPSWHELTRNEIQNVIANHKNAAELLKKRRQQSLSLVSKKANVSSTSGGISASSIQSGALRASDIISDSTSKLPHRASEPVFNGDRRYQQNIPQRAAQPVFIADSVPLKPQNVVHNAGQQGVRNIQRVVQPVYSANSIPLKPQNVNNPGQQGVRNIPQRTAQPFFIADSVPLKPQNVVHNAGQQGVRNIPQRVVQPVYSANSIPLKPQNVNNRGGYEQVGRNTERVYSADSIPLKSQNAYDQSGYERHEQSFGMEPSYPSLSQANQMYRPMRRSAPPATATINYRNEDANLGGTHSEDLPPVLACNLMGTKQTQPLKNNYGAQPMVGSIRPPPKLYSGQPLRRGIPASKLTTEKWQASDF